MVIPVVAASSSLRRVGFYLGGKLVSQGLTHIEGFFERLRSG